MQSLLFQLIFITTLKMCSSRTRNSTPKRYKNPTLKSQQICKFTYFKEISYKIRRVIHPISHKIQMHNKYSCCYVSCNEGKVAGKQCERTHLLTLPCETRDPRFPGTHRSHAGHTQPASRAFNSPPASLVCQYGFFKSILFKLNFI